MNSNEQQQGRYVWTKEHLQDAVKSSAGQWLSAHLDNSHSNEHFEATRIITDTRKLESGDIFLALRGDNFDGHNFLDTATKKGAIAAIVSEPCDDIALPQLLVPDTRVALGQLAAYRRAQHDTIKLIAITGSSGKTTVKEMLRAIFNNFAPTLATKGNLNNDLGVPMTLLEMAAEHRYGIIELGANHVGEIAYTADIVKPDVACVLNIGTAHLGEFGGQDNIAKAKAEIYCALTQSGVAVVPYDDDYYQQLSDKASQHTNNLISFGWQKDVAAPEAGDMTQVCATNVVSSALQSTFDLQVRRPNGDMTCEAITLPMSGQHNISNALAATACAIALGVDAATIAKGLRQARGAKGRLQWQTFGQHHIIDDTYNANPNSVRAAADVLAVQSGKTIMILGDIGELGEAAIEEHYKLGQDITSKPITTLLCVGQYAKDTVAGAVHGGFTQAYAYQSKLDLLRDLKQLIEQATATNQCCTLLFKGSRSAAMETLITDLVTTR